MPQIIKQYIKTCCYHFRLFLYWAILPFKVYRIRKKERIRVLFVLSELSCWKSEALFELMLKHPRFDPVIGLSTPQFFSERDHDLVSYLESRKYPFCNLDKPGAGIESINPDIIFYYKPYPECYSAGLYFNNYLKYVFCGLDYCTEVTKHVAHLERELFDYCWQFYVEHSDIAQRRKEILGYRARNTKLTGVPMQDVLMRPSAMFSDPWKDKSGRKRIIYAPHHSIKGTNGDGIEFATFLEYGELILDLAKRYKDRATFAFKPHPNLYMKLVRIWGQEKTDRYYAEWDAGTDMQIETGEYVGLFKYSDAIIHDCASFITEYLYMDNPSLYLVSEDNRFDDMFDFVQEGFHCYEHGRSAEDIDIFIRNVIAGIDSRQTVRRNYISRQLMPPGGKAASENIVDAILG